ncbi:mediator-associated protein 1-like [Dorcoceras hygrometricum]|uniref:Mediator-associated protein 1-like n=1 Tax=Dorcoceras hygrometricum TaxID=472368 RepID=A0A2Z7DFQ0_9LAMI|nr:mediator-associated protein 1-like [Dorcoceras hygrometricum]
MGIDQLNLHSVQLGYLKILQVGNTDPNNTKQENKYEVKPQYEELSKQLNMQHTINQCYKCMRAIKDRIAKPASRLAIISVEPLYHAQQVSWWKSSVRDLQAPSAHHSSVVFRHDKSVGHHSDDSVGLLRHDNRNNQSQQPVTTTSHNNQSLHFSSHAQNDAAPTNRNDVVALHQLLVTQSQHISQNFAPAASSNHHKHNYCQTQQRHAHVISTDFQNSPGESYSKPDVSYRSLVLPDFAKIRYVCFLN